MNVAHSKQQGQLSGCQRLLSATELERAPWLPTTGLPLHGQWPGQLTIRFIAAGWNSLTPRITGWGHPGSFYDQDEMLEELLHRASGNSLSEQG